MTKTKTIRPSPSYSVTVPEEACVKHEGRVTSLWQRGAPDLLLQLSSYTRNDGDQLGARKRLQDRMAKHRGKWTGRELEIPMAHTADQAAAEILDENAVLWIHAYLVWPHLAVYATVSGPEHSVRTPGNWAMAAIESITLAVQ